MPDRRELLLTAFAASLSSCAAVAAPDGPPDGSLRPIADAHVHLFNAADLPVGKFARYVFLFEHFRDAPEALEAFVDFLLNVIKPLTIAASREPIRGPSQAALADDTPDVPPEELRRRVDARIRSLAPGQKALDAGPGAASLLDGYAEISRLLSGLSNKAMPGAELKLDSPAGKAALASVAGELFEQAARSAYAPEAFEAELIDKGLSPAEAVAKIGRLIGWAWLMCQSRQYHLRQYLREYGAPGMPGPPGKPDQPPRTPRLLVNHLVDYDKWLGDRPSPGSRHADQIRFWARAREAWAARVDIHTFAGYCPLKHAIEAAEGGGRAKTFEARKADYDARRISGFKLYPPMGFQASGNAELCDSTARPCPTNSRFASKDGLGDTAVDAWEKAAGKRPLGPALDEALKTFLTWASRAENDVPLMAHAESGNSTGVDFGLRANPAYWMAAAKGLPIRLSLGHLVDKVEEFVRVERRPSEINPENPLHWAFGAPRDMLVQGGRIYGDIGYTPELARDETLARDFFLALKRLFGPRDPGLEQLLYGSDWIMVAQEKHDTRFAERVVAGMVAAEYTPEMIDNILWRNARRFLKLPL